MNTFETKVKGVMNVLLDIEKQFGTDVPVSMVSILLMVPLDDSVSVQKIRQTSSLTEAGVSRVLATLNAHNLQHRRRIEKLIEIFIDEKDRRYRHVELTRLGRDVVKKLMRHLDTWDV